MAQIIIDKTLFFNSLWKLLNSAFQIRQSHFQFIDSLKLLKDLQMFIICDLIFTEHTADLCVTRLWITSSVMVIKILFFIIRQFELFESNKILIMLPVCLTFR